MEAHVHLRRQAVHQCCRQAVPREDEVPDRARGYHMATFCFNFA